MPNTISNGLNLIGRILLITLFLPAGISKLTDFGGTTEYIASVGLPLPALCAVLAMSIEILGSLALLAGFGTRVVALILAIFTLLVSFSFHAFWAVPADQAFVTQLLFAKNIAVIGGLLILAAQGSGAWSVDSRRKYN